MKYLLLSFLLFLVSCAHTPTLTKWQGNEMTLCCYRCNDGEWNKSVKHHCQGTAKQTGGETKEKISGFDTTKTKLNSGMETTTTRPKISKVECRTFQCDGTLNPNEAVN